MKFSNKDIELHSNQIVKTLKKFSIPNVQNFITADGYKIRTELNKMVVQFSYGNIILCKENDIRQLLAYYKAVLTKLIEVRDKTFTFSNEEDKNTFNKKVEAIIKALESFNENKKSVH